MATNTSKILSGPKLPETPQLATPQLAKRDPSLPLTTIRSRSRSRIIIKDPYDPDQQSTTKKCCIYLYNRNNKTYCDRSCSSWGAIIAYSIMYFTFLSTYTMIFLYGSLSLIKTLPANPNKNPEAFELTYSDSLSLTVTPISEDSYPLIRYRRGEADDYEKYVNAIDKLFSDHRPKRSIINNLGPCGEPPYGYGDEPCIFIRISQNLWSAKPLQPNSPTAKDVPDEVRNWMKLDKKFWLHCTGFHSYDKEHVRNLRYYPNPPGFDSDLFPVNRTMKTQLVAVQISNFTLGISLAIECKVWFETGVSSVAFMLYVVPKSYRNNPSLRINHGRY